MFNKIIVINIIPSAEDLNDKDFNVVSPLLSNLDELKFIKSDSLNDKVNDAGIECLGVFYDYKTFKNIDVDVFVTNLLRTCKSENMFDEIEFNIVVNYVHDIDMFTDEIGIALMQLDERLLDTPYYEESSPSLSIIYENYDEENNTFNFDNEDPEYDESDEEDENADVEQLLSMLKNGNGDLPEERNDRLAEFLEGLKQGDEPDHQKFKSSRILKSLKNPKKSFKRHGILIANNKHAMKADKKIIKAFLKVFIPGNSPWIHELRESVLERWMQTFIISKKQLKRLEKDYRKQQVKSKDGKKLNNQRGRSFAQTIFNKDSWSNPNK